MNEFCVKCCEKDAQIECMRARLDELKVENERIRRQNDALINDIAFYGMRARLDELKIENERIRRQNDALINDIAFYEGKFPKEMKDA